MLSFLSNLILFLYFTAAGTLMIYGLNCYVMIFLFHNGRSKAQAYRKDIAAKSGDFTMQNYLPVITTQIAIFNELNVAERVINAVCRMSYPKTKHEIQVLDDSTDETQQKVDDIAAGLKAEGYDIHVIRRITRTGYKAGALANGLEKAKGEFIAVFDADFVPPKDYLFCTIPFFMADKKLGLVQTRWGHLNRDRSMLTKAQCIGIDGHFMVEQAARNWNNLYMNFNGTAGIWRRTAVKDGGGWQWDTLTEDMDLSYRVQFAGWQTIFLPNVVVPAEIPEDISAFKSQQFRWAKGSIQTALKLMPELVKQPVPVFQKIQAFFHMTHYLVHPLMLTLSILALPVLIIADIGLAPVIFGLVALILAISMMAPSALYAVSQRAAYSDWFFRLLCLPFLITLGVGVALSNSKAVFEALAGRESGFIRTPKRGDKEIKKYRAAVSWLSIFEIIMGIYCVLSLNYYLVAGKYLIGPFLGVYAAGFLLVGLLTFAHSLGINR